MPLTQMIYISDVAPNVSEWEQPFSFVLNMIHEKARVNNRKVGVTGILLFNSGHFLQVLEGHHLVLNRLYDKISRDTRHINMERLACFAIEHRIFEQWNMGLLNLEDKHDMDRDRFREIVRQLRFIAPSDQDTARTTVVSLLRKFQERLLDHSELVSAS